MRRFFGHGTTALAMRLDVYVVGDLEAWVLAPSGMRLPMAEVGVLGRLRWWGRLDAEQALTAEQRPAVIRDIDARGYGIVAAGDLSAVDGRTDAASNDAAEQRLAA